MPLDMTPSDTYDTPDSTPDPYASSSSTSANSNYGLPSHIDLSSLPSGLPILGPLTGYTPASRAARMREHMAAVSQTIQRPLTRSEQEAMAYHSAKGIAWASWGPTIGIAAGVYRTYATRAEFRWPFYGKLISGVPAEGETQKGFWDGQKMRAGGKEMFQAVSTQAKANALHVLRGCAYCSFGLLFGPLFVSSYAGTVCAVGELRDPRLQEVNQWLREALLKETKQKKEKAGDIVKQTDARRIPRDGDRMSGRRAGVAEVDDASPTGGAGIMMDMGTDDEQERLGGAGDMAGVLSDGRMRTAEARARPSPAQSPTSNRTDQLEKFERQLNDFASDFAADDDASPTGAMDGDGGAGGSVWERIRQQTASDPSSSSSSDSSSTGRARGAIGSSSGVPQQREGTSTTGNDNNSFMFSSSDAGERSEAQREFDERVEKERRGGDFSSSDGGVRRRW